MRKHITCFYCFLCFLRHSARLAPTLSRFIRRSTRTVQAFLPRLSFEILEAIVLPDFRAIDILFNNIFFFSFFRRKLGQLLHFLFCRNTILIHDGLCLDLLTFKLPHCTLLFAGF
eukprot:UN00587